jgi:hypothetical protein
VTSTSTSSTDHRVTSTPKLDPSKASRESLLNRLSLTLPPTFCTEKPPPSNTSSSKCYLDEVMEIFFETYEELEVKRESEMRSWSSKCSITTYAPDFPVALHDYPRECNFRNNAMLTSSDPWFNYYFVDRCLARYCLTSMSSAVAAFTRTAGPITEADTYTIRKLSVSYWKLPKTRLTASDEDPNYISWSYGEIFTYTSVRTSRWRF